MFIRVVLSASATIASTSNGDDEHERSASIDSRRYVSFRSHRRTCTGVMVIPGVLKCLAVGLLRRSLGSVRACSTTIRLNACVYTLRRR